MDDWRMRDLLRNLEEAWPDGEQVRAVLTEAINEEGDERFECGKEAGEETGYQRGCDDMEAELTPDPDHYWETADIERGAVSAEWVVMRIAS